jgi:hypothetical protein
MAKPFKVAGECDSWCTRCRMLLNHRIVSMQNAKPHQVLCLTCNTQHLFRPNAPGEKAASSGGGGSTRAPAAPRGPTRAEQARIGREQTWEKAIAGRAMSEFKAYNVSAVFHEGDLVRHKKFGDGVVTRVIDAGKVEILFKDEPKTLAHNLPA